MALHGSTVCFAMTLFLGSYSTETENFILSAGVSGAVIHLQDQLFGGVGYKPGVVERVSFGESRGMVRVERGNPVAVLVLGAHKTGFWVEQLYPAFRAFQEMGIVFGVSA